MPHNSERSPGLLAANAAGARARFERLVIRGPECWEWVGQIKKSGYGTFFLRGRTEMAHRVAVALDGRDLGKGDVVMHSCDNRKCVRPDHLSVGKIQDNIDDCVAKGRHRWNPNLGRKGVENNNAVLNPDKVAQIRAMHAQGMSQRKIAAAIGTGRGAVRDVVRGVTWR